MSIPCKRLIALGFVALLPWACDFPTDPDNDQTSSSQQQTEVAASNAGRVMAITFVPSSLPTLEVGASTSFQVQVTYDRGESNEPLPSSLALITDLGTFTSSTGSAQLTQSVQLAQVGSTNTFQGTTSDIAFFAGSTAGTAKITAGFAGSNQNASVTVAPATGLFLQNVSPAAGPASGGNTVTINGQGFTSGARATFGSVAASVQNSSAITSTSTGISVTVPPSSVQVATGTVRVVDVTVEVPATDVTEQQTDTLKGAYTYTAGGTGTTVPTIQRLDPSFGDNAGSTSPVTIFGSGFVDPVMVSIGSGSSQSSFTGITVPATDVGTVVNLPNNSTSVTLSSWPAATPSQLNSSVDVLLVNMTSGLGAVAQNAYTYQSPDVVVNIDPTSLNYLDTLPASNSTGSPSASMVSIDMRGVVQGRSYRLEFGGQTQNSFTPSSSGSFTLDIPLSDLSAVNVSNCSPPSGAVMITDTVTTEAAVGPTFSFTADTPTLGTLSPTSATAGGTLGNLTINGTFSSRELQSNTQVLIGGQNAPVSSASGSSITAAIPTFTGTFDEVSCSVGTQSGTRLSSKQVDVEVIYTLSGCNAVKTNGFTYDPPDSTCVVTTDPPTAGFTWSPDPSNQLMVNFVDTSSGATSGTWFFGDGAQSSCQVNSGVAECSQSHSYQASGSYTATLRVTNSAGSDSFSQTVTVGVMPAAFFTLSPQAVTAGTPVTFTNQSTVDSSTVCRWSFGNGQTLNDPGCSTNPTQTYAAAGTFTVQLTASNGLGTDTFSVDITVAAGP